MTQPPEIKLNGKQVQNVEYNSNNGIYIDPEVSIISEDKDEVEITTYGNVNVNTVDDYELKCC